MRSTHEFSDAVKKAAPSSRPDAHRDDKSARQQLGGKAAFWRATPASDIREFCQALKGREFFDAGKRARLKTIKANQAGRRRR